jgi:hypothetical protein
MMRCLVRYEGFTTDDEITCGGLPGLGLLYSVQKLSLQTEPRQFPESPAYTFYLHCLHK